ncbi:tryptophan halogenase [Caulobacter sp. D4A]|uniref:tryptophan halogenase family protein n=1 Tax=unclassified Caulobacter TaxID=2648921 RepID=UPI000D737A9D|nr:MULTISPECIES: tryptophan halogenase family protein [unclassified Caulobacter]PXA87651.1 tryptophan halogenase [Caulobacter sp. D5]PXA89877.1 tryptophan halogenase [Caulobacter sp. D4A]
MANNLRKIVIVGGGSAGWITAAMLSHYLKDSSCEIELIESEQIGIIGVGESTIPPFLQLIRGLGIDEVEFMQETQAAFKLAIRFENWRQKGEVYYHPFGLIGGPVDVHEFYQVWLRGKAEGHPAALQDFAPASVMADRWKFMSPAMAPRTMIANANYAVHIDAALLAKFLRKFAEARGVKRTEGIVSDVATRPDGFIEKVILQDGREASGDLFIDCSGFRSLLNGKTLGTEFLDWSDVLLCDRAIAVQTANLRDPHPYTLAQAQDSGWRWRIPLQHRAGNGYVYCSQFCSDDEARATLMSQVEGEAVREPWLVPFKTGMRKQLFNKNCVAIGLAGGFIEPLESTALHLIYRGVDYLLRFFPDRDCDATLAAEYNRRMRADYEEIRDFIVLHYFTTKRDDTPFWRAYQQVTPPESLRERIALFKAGGVLRDGVDDMFRAPSWQSVMEGMGIRPQRYQQLVDTLPAGVVKGLLDKSAPMLSDLVDTLPSHGDFLRQYCPAPVPEALRKAG